MSAQPRHTNDVILKVPPHSIEAERSVLGAVLLKPECLDDITLSADEFYRSDHRTIFRAMRDCASKGRPPDIITVAETLDEIRELEGIGGVKFLSDLIDGTPNATNVGAYARIVRERATLRMLISIGHELSARGFESDLQAGSKAIDALARVSLGDVTSLHDMPSLTRAVFERIDRIQSNPEANGLPTGFKDIDRVLGNMQPGDLVVVGARPSTGKTQFMCNIARYVAVNLGKGVGIQEAESPALQITHRFLAALANVRAIRFRTGAFDDADYPRLTSAVPKLTSAPIYIDDRGSPDISHVESVARRLRRERRIELFCVDHLTKIRTEAYRDQKRLQVGDVTYRLKELAKELGIPILALAQLQRDSEGRRPTLKDLKESGNIEEDADNIILLHPDKDEKGKLHAIIAKNREGPTCDLHLANFKEFMRIEDWSGENSEPSY